LLQHQPALGMWSDESYAERGNLRAEKMPGSVRDKAGSLVITKVESIKFSDKINIGGGSGGDGKDEFCRVRITTNTGITGICET